MTARKTLKTLTITFAALGAAMSTAIAPAAFATPADDVSVEFDTRYLETDWGVEKIYNTLSNRAESACSRGSAIDISSRRLERDCMTDLLDDFIKSANHEKLTTLHTNMTS